MSYKAWRYHSDHEPRIFEGEEAVTAAELEGWKDSPAKCEGFLDKVGIDPNNKLQVQYIAEVAEQTSEVLNLIENIDELDKTGLLRLVELQFAEDWSKRRVNLAKLRKSVKKRLDADNVIEA